MCEMPECMHKMWYFEDNIVKKINNDFATDYLYRIFMFGSGKSREHDLSVRNFQDFLHQRGIDYSIRALYDYAEGKLPFPAALIPYLIEFSKDQKLIALFLPSIKSAIFELNSQYEKEERNLKGKMEEMRRTREDLSLDHLNGDK